MEENNNLGMDERTSLLNKALGLSLILIGAYGLIYAYKMFKTN
jgi:hypothetical protein